MKPNHQAFPGIFSLKHATWRPLRSSIVFTDSKTYKKIAFNRIISSLSNVDISLCTLELNYFNEINYHLKKFMHTVLLRTQQIINYWSI